jgi:hypothetical protein
MEPRDIPLLAGNALLGALMAMNVAYAANSTEATVSATIEDWIICDAHGCRSANGAEPVQIITPHGIDYIYHRPDFSQKKPLSLH